MSKSTKSDSPNSRCLQKEIRKKIANRQNNKCANSPGVNLRGMGKYKCLLWEKITNKGSFDEAGYQVDHIIEYCLSADDNESNLQALCPQCHSVKTKWFMHNKKTIKMDHYKNNNNMSEITNH
jgi:5-methylcytosine-specific restriction endonuclease McrA